MRAAVKTKGTIQMPRKSVTCQLRVALKGSRPPIWRRFQISPRWSLADLHDVVQAVMGWEDSHLHAFSKGRRRFSIPNPWLDDWGEPDLDSRKYRIGQLLRREKDWIDYTYDFGDCWRHRITLQKILPLDRKVRLPVCISGRRRCPPEDSGGLWGYYRNLRIMEHPAHDEYEDTWSWMGRDFDPTQFSVEEVNAKLREWFR